MYEPFKIRLRNNCHPAIRINVVEFFLFKKFDSTTRNISVGMTYHFVHVVQNINTKLIWSFIVNCTLLRKFIIFLISHFSTTISFKIRGTRFLVHYSWQIGHFWYFVTNVKLTVPMIISSAWVMRRSRAIQV